AALPPLARVLPDRQGRVAAQARYGPPRPQPGRPRTRTDPHPPALGEGQGCMRTRIPIEEGQKSRDGAALRFIPNVRSRIMTVQTVSLSSLEPGRGNPRKARNGIEGLAASIRTDGLLQNLVVKPVKGEGEHYRIVSGERRYRALKLLQERGELDEDFGVPVEIRVNLSKDDSLRIATVENLQRQTLTPLEEAAALTKLIHNGTTLDDVAAQTGLSQTTIKRR